MLKSHYRDVYRNQYKHWWYRGMASINRTLLDYYLVKKRGLKILDAGCGPGAMLHHLKKYGDVIGVDISEDALVYARKIGKVQKGDITKLEFKNNSFDLVVCMDVLYHMWVKDTSKALSEFDRVLKKDGILLLREPAYNWMRGNEDRGSLTARRFSREVLRRDLKRSSFKLLKISYANFFLFPAVFIIRIFTMIGLVKGESDMVLPIKVVNELLYSVLRLEGFLMKHISLPFGSSLISVAQKVK